MRYISHEMRTPLNVACLGMKILHDELKRLGLFSLLETAMDTQKACQNAIDILNDMLLYDKIVSGLMTLEKRLFDPLDFTAKVLNPFQLQVCHWCSAFACPCPGMTVSMYVYVC